MRDIRPEATSKRWRNDEEMNKILSSESKAEINFKTACAFNFWNNWVTLHPVLGSLGTSGLLLLSNCLSSHVGKSCGKSCRKSYSPVPRGPSMAKDSQKMFQIEARGQKQWYWRLEKVGAVICGQILMGFAYLWMVWVLNDRCSFRPTKRGQRPKLTSEVRWPFCQNDIKSIPGAIPST